jgi:hypothetical protein
VLQAVPRQGLLVVVRSESRYVASKFVVEELRPLAHDRTDSSIMSPVSFVVATDTHSIADALKLSMGRVHAMPATHAARLAQPQACIFEELDPPLYILDDNKSIKVVCLPSERSTRVVWVYRCTINRNCHA